MKNMGFMVEFLWSLTLPQVFDRKRSIGALTSYRQKYRQTAHGAHDLERLQESHILHIDQ
ncbi:MAG: hypothetical protein HY778_07395 [Betaproteobacteria bacterium]|nr:hypothetical protein [Betaproteobacteria bacterium]